MRILLLALLLPAGCLEPEDDRVQLAEDFEAGEPGELIAPGAPVAVVVDLDRAWVNAYVEEPVVPTLRLDAEAAVVTDAGDRLAGRIAFIAPRAEFTPRNVQTSAERARLVYRVRVTVDNTAGILKPGMPVEVEFASGGS